ncbi:MAG: tetratricopeptide repeat protein [Candidatus Gastranaerophilales bacterium]|nr:tetratricopeptide repeat protein [Candidatus Gastranaerophilales bacterium]
MELDVKNYNIARANYEKGEIKIAIEYFKKAIEINSEYFEAYYNLGVIYYMNEEYDPAIATLKRAVEINKDYDAYYNLGLSYFSKNDYENAVKSFTQAISISNKDPDIFYNRGLGYYNLATDDFKETIKLDSDHSNAICALNHVLKFMLPDNNAEIFYKQGIVNIEKEEYYLAIENFRKAVQLDPLHSKAKESLFFVNKLLNTPKTENSLNYINLGKNYYSKSEYELAIQNFDKAISLNPGNYEAYYYLGIIYAEIEKHDHALPAFQKALELNPGHAESKASLECILALNSPKEATDETQSDDKTSTNNEPENKKEETSDEDEEYYYNLAMSHSEKGEYYQAIDNLKKSLKINPVYGKSKTALFSIMQVINKSNEAGKNLVDNVHEARKNIEANKEETEEYYYKLAMDYSETGEYYKAMENLQKSLKINPKFTKSQTALYQIMQSMNKR